jgi:hypothetical protein
MKNPNSRSIPFQLPPVTDEYGPPTDEPLAEEDRSNGALADHRTQNGDDLGQEAPWTFIRSRGSSENGFSASGGRCRRLQTKV